jgi:hypothetical protein
MVGGQLICCTPRHEKPHRSGHESWKRRHILHIHKKETQYKSSTEAELVAIDDAMAQVLWTRQFLAAQGEYVPTTTIYQDNKSTILLA